MRFKRKFRFEVEKNMKKLLLGLTVAFAAFFGGVLTTELFRLKQKLMTTPNVEAIKIANTRALRAEFLQAAQTATADDLSIQNDFGWYRLENYRGMEEVGMISLSRDDEMKEDRTVTAKDVSSGGIYISFNEDDDTKFVESVWAEVDEKKAKFRTNKIKGIEYRFEGVFYNNKTSGYDGEKVLRGVLRKYVKGKKIAEARGDFAYYEPRCW